MGNRKLGSGKIGQQKRESMKKGQCEVSVGKKTENWARVISTTGKRGNFCCQNWQWAADKGGNEIRLHVTCWSKGSLTGLKALVCRRRLLTR